MQSSILDWLEPSGFCREQATGTDGIEGDENYDSLITAEVSRFDSYDTDSLSAANGRLDGTWGVSSQSGGHSAETPVVCGEVWQGRLRRTTATLRRDKSHTRNSHS